MADIARLSEVIEPEARALGFELVRVKLFGFLQTFVRKRVVVTLARHLRKLRENIVQEECEPDAFAYAFVAYLVHPVVPVAGTDERQAMWTKAQTMSDRPYAMFKQRPADVAARRQIIEGFFFRMKEPAFQVADGSVQHGRVASDLDVPGYHIGQPKHIIGAMGSDTSSFRRMPPMLYIALHELPGRM